MQIIKSVRIANCNGSDECNGVAKYILHFGKKKVYLCEECMRELNIACSNMLAPRSIKSKFNNLKGRKV